MLGAELRDERQCHGVRVGQVGGAPRPTCPLVLPRPPCSLPPPLPCRMHRRVARRQVRASRQAAHLPALQGRRAPWAPNDHNCGDDDYGGTGLDGAGGDGGGTDTSGAAGGGAGGAYAGRGGGCLRPETGGSVPRASWRVDMSVCTWYVSAVCACVASLSRSCTFSLSGRV